MARKDENEYDKLVESVSKDPLKAIYLLYGSEQFLIDRGISLLLNKRFGTTDVTATEYEHRRASEVRARDTIAGLKTVSMFGGPKFVLYKEAELLKADDLEVLVDYVRNPVRATLILAGTSIDFRKSAWQTIKKSAFSVNLSPLPDYAISKWALSEARMREIKLTSSAAQTLAMLIGSNLSQVDMALEKIALAYGKREITDDMVEEVVIDTREKSVFELSKAVSARDLYKALYAFAGLMEQKQEPIMINAVLARQVRQLLCVKVGLIRKESDAKIAEKSGISSYFFQEYKSGALKYTYTELTNFMNRIYRADVSMKSSRMSSPMIMQKMLIESLSGN